MKVYTVRYEGFDYDVNEAFSTMELAEEMVKRVGVGYIQEYEVKDNHLALTLLRSTGIISNPKNPARTTPAGPPLDVNDLQMLGRNKAEFYVFEFI